MHQQKTMPFFDGRRKLLTLYWLNDRHGGDHISPTLPVGWGCQFTNMEFKTV